MGFGVTCWIDDKQVFELGVDMAEPDVATEMAVDVLQSLLQRKVLGEGHEMGSQITRIIVERDAEPSGGGTSRHSSPRGPRHAE